MTRKTYVDTPLPVSQILMPVARADVLVRSSGCCRDGQERSHHYPWRKDLKRSSFSRSRSETHGENHTYCTAFLARPVFHSLINRIFNLGHEMGPAFAKHVASLEGVTVKSLEQLIDFNREASRVIIHQR